MKTAQTAHTPGPWAFDIQQAECIIYGRNERDLDEIGVAIESEIEGRTIANARLIAAAPDMLAALEAALPYQEAYCECLERIPEEEGGDPAFNTLEQIRAAIAKAKGE